MLDTIAGLVQCMPNISPRKSFASICCKIRTYKCMGNCRNSGSFGRFGLQIFAPQPGIISFIIWWKVINEAAPGPFKKRIDSLIALVLR